MIIATVLKSGGEYRAERFGHSDAEMSCSRNSDQQKNQKPETAFNADNNSNI